jgi:hypothetical protein
MDRQEGELEEIWKDVGDMERCRRWVDSIACLADINSDIESWTNEVNHVLLESSRSFCTFVFVEAVGLPICGPFCLPLEVFASNFACV